MSKDQIIKQLTNDLAVLRCTVGNRQWLLGDDTAKMPEQASDVLRPESAIAVAGVLLLVSGFSFDLHAIGFGRFCVPAGMLACVGSVCVGIARGSRESGGDG